MTDKFAFIEDYFQKADLLPAIVQERSTGQVCVRPLKQAIHGFTAVHVRSFGTKVRQAVIYRR